MSKILITLINLYQKTISPDHSAFGRARYPYGYCRFSPSCSEYAKQILEKRGLWGIGAIVLRILKCNPLSKPALDPVKTV